MRWAGLQKLRKEAAGLGGRLGRSSANRAESEFVRISPASRTTNFLGGFQNFLSAPHQKKGAPFLCERNYSGPQATYGAKKLRDVDCGGISEVLLANTSFRDAPFLQHYREISG